MNILTFDVEDWYHLLDNESTKTESDWSKFPCRMDGNMDRVFEFLDASQKKATFFCLGWVARKYPDLIRKIDARGCEVAAHSDLHQLVYDQTPKQFKNDVETSTKSLEDITGKKVRAYRAPGFSITQNNKFAFDTLLECGIEIDCSVFPANRAHGGFKGFGTAEPCRIEVNGVYLKEFPMNTFGILGQQVVFSGGGYFRFFPIPILRYMMSRSNYVMTYFHPRDFDANQPIIGGLGAFRRFKSYYGLGRCMKKLEKITREFPFIDLETAEKRIDWSNTRVVKI